MSNAEHLPDDKDEIYSKIIKALQLALYSLPILAILAYFSGWWYRNRYFSEFGINRSSIQAPDYTVFVHAFSVLAQVPRVIFDLRHVESLVVPFLALVLVLLAILFPRIESNISRAIKDQYRSISKAVFSTIHWTTLGIIAVFCIFALSSEVGRREATDILEFGSGRHVNLIFSDDALDLEESNHFYRLRESAKIVLIWRDASETIVIDFKNSYTPLDVYRIDNDYVVGIVYDVRRG